MDKKWKEVGYDKKDAVPFKGTMLEAVRQVNRQLRQSGAYKRIIARLKADAGIEADREKNGD